MSVRKRPTVITYEPDNSLKKGYVFLFNEIFNDIIENRWLTYQLFKRDLLSVYKQSFAGMVWVVILPVVGVSIFVVLNLSGIFSIGDVAVPYPIYAVLGMAFWQLLSTGLVSCTSSLVDAGPMILKINFSKKSLVIASAGKSMLSFLVQMILAGILFLWYGFKPSIAIALIPLMVFPLILFMLGLGFLLSLLNGIVRDMGNMVAIFLTFLMFLTPVFYAKPRTGILAKMASLNPLYYLTSTPRDLILRGTTSEWSGFWITCGVSFLVFVICLAAFHLTETRVTERI